MQTLSNGVRSFLAVLAGFDLTHWRIPGVLQRFGITYFVVALTELLTTELYSRWKVREGGEGGSGRGGRGGGRKRGRGGRGKRWRGDRDGEGMEGEE